MSKVPLVFSIIGVTVGILPFGGIVGLVFSILGFSRGSAQVKQARADPRHVGIGMAHTAKWLGLGAMIQNIIFTVVEVIHLILICVAAAAAASDY